jgi:hypothetical protein
MEPILESQHATRVALRHHNINVTMYYDAPELCHHFVNKIVYSNLAMTGVHGGMQAVASYR